MSTLRHKFRIMLDGQTHELTTSARDMATLDTTGEVPEVVQTMHVLYAACLRLGIEVPDNVDDFMDLLDDIDDLEEEGKEENPTQVATSAA